VQQKQGLYPYLSPWCKPAINLYPTKKNTLIHVEVNPAGRLNYTNPVYPAAGWEVYADPDGTIHDNNAVYPYLYWEAAIPDTKITQPQDGYIVAYSSLNNLFSTILPEIGLNRREEEQFSGYWLKTLPVSAFYFVGVMPQDEINTLAPLSITPVPQSLLRVSLYFKALSSDNTAVIHPILKGFKRSGFTVTEWGGFLKLDKNHPNFTCEM